MCGEDMKRIASYGYLYAVVLVLIVAAFVVMSAFAEQTVDLEPTYRLVNGDQEFGVVYEIGGGYLVLTARWQGYVCGCDATSCDLSEVPFIPLPPDFPTEEPGPPGEPTQEPKCNRGLGNGSEGCDPGNSPGKPGRAGEDNNA